MNLNKRLLAPLLLTIIEMCFIFPQCLQNHLKIIQFCLNSSLLLVSVRPIFNNVITKLMHALCRRRHSNLTNKLLLCNMCIELRTQTEIHVESFSELAGMYREVTIHCFVCIGYFRDVLPPFYFGALCNFPSIFHALDMLSMVETPVLINYVVNTVNLYKQVWARSDAE